MGVAIYGAAHIYGDKISIMSTSKPEFMLNNKSKTVCYHPVRESVTMGNLYNTYTWARKLSRPNDKNIIREQTSISNF